MSLQRILLCACLLSLPLPLAATADVAGLQADIDAKTEEVARVREQLTREERQAEQVEAELAALRQSADALAQRKAETLTALKAQFERVLADPTLDLSAVQQAYREAFAAMDSQAEAVAAKEQQLAEQQRRVGTLRESAERAAEILVDLRAGLDRARAERLFTELNVVGEITLSNTVTCARDETIAACIARAEDSARGLARERFGRQLLAAVTEADLVAQHSDAEGTAPTLVDSTVAKSEFRGQGDYFIELSARLRNDISQAEACRLLGLSDAQCQGETSAPAPTDPVPPEQDLTSAEDAVPETLPEAPATAPPAAATAPPAADAAPADEPTATGDAQYRLTVRSNVYYDEVFIDGVAYGSTKLDVMLPAGEYDLEVRKPGHSSYRERVTLSGNRTITAELAELAELVE